MAKEIVRLVTRTRNKIAREVALSINRENIYSRGLDEGYQGGYIAALGDVLLALNGVLPRRNGWWEAAEQADEADLSTGG